MFRTVKDYRNPEQILQGIKEIENLNLKLIENLSENEETYNETGRVSWKICLKITQQIHETFKGQFYACIRKQQIQIDDLRVQSELMEQQIERLTERTQGNVPLIFNHRVWAVL